EEPPANTVFVLCTTEPHKVLPTIVDRCQRFDFQRPSLEQIAEVVQRVAGAESIGIEPGAVAAIARSAGGSFRDALGTLDQIVAYGGKQVATDDVMAVLGVAESELILAAADAIAAEDGRAALEASERLTRSGRDVSQFGRDLLAHLRQLVVVRAVGEVPDAFSVTAGEPERLEAQAAAFSDLALARAIDTIAKALADIKEGDEPRMTLELAILRAARPQLDPTRQALLQRIESLERAVGGSGDAPDGPRRIEPTQVSAQSRQARPHGSRTPPPRAASRRAESSDTQADSGDGDSDAARIAAAQGQAGPSSGVGVKEGLDLERMLGLWPAVLEQMRESGSELLSTVFSAAKPVAVDLQEGVLELGFPSSAAVNKRKAEAQEARERISEAVVSVVGERLRPIYKLVEGGEGGDRSPAISEEELIERLKSEFDAEEFDEAEKLNEEAR